MNCAGIWDVCGLPVTHKKQGSVLRTSLITSEIK